MSQEVPLNDLKWTADISQFDESFIKSDEGYSLEVDILCQGNLHNLRNDLTFLPERMKIKKVENLGANLHYKTEHVIHIKNLKHAFNYGLVLKKFHRNINFNQKAWLKPY